MDKFYYENPKLTSRRSSAVVAVFSRRFFRKRKEKKRKKNARLVFTILLQKSQHTHKRKKCLNQKDQRSGSIWVRRTPASACGTCSRLFFFLNRSVFLRAANETRRFVNRIFCRRGPIEIFSFPEKESFSSRRKKPTPLLLRANEREKFVLEDEF